MQWISLFKHQNLQEPKHGSLRIRAHLCWRTGKHLHVLHVLRTYPTCSYPGYQDTTTYAALPGLNCDSCIYTHVVTLYCIVYWNTLWFTIFSTCPTEKVFVKQGKLGKYDCKKMSLWNVEWGHLDRASVSIQESAGPKQEGPLLLYCDLTPSL